MMLNFFMFECKTGKKLMWLEEIEFDTLCMCAQGAPSTLVFVLNLSGFGW